MPEILAAEVATIGDYIGIRRFQSCFRLLGHMGKLCSVAPDIGHFMRDDQMMLGVDGDLNVVTDDT
jgi:hypothetical protein